MENEDKICDKCKHLLKNHTPTCDVAIGKVKDPSLCEDPYIRCGCEGS